MLPSAAKVTPQSGKRRAVRARGRERAQPGLTLRNLGVLLRSQRFELSDFFVERCRATPISNRRDQPRDLLVRLSPVALVPRQLRREVIGLGEALGGFPDQGV
ncbi:hypothetical protein [Armatimonas sp.]|uniref:hypothetical protein n=1 Tax=Armatimonas sp. TaxID=1872638 RepID=UPI00374D3FA8